MADGNTQSKKVAMAKFGKPHGVKGDIMLYSSTEPEEALFEYGAFFMSDDSIIEIEQYKRHKNGFIVRMAGIDTREKAEVLVNNSLYIDRAGLSDIDDEDSFYIVDLEGLTVQAPDTTAIGVIEAVHNFGAGDIVELRLTATDKTEMVLFTHENFPKVDIAKGYVVCDMPDEIFAQEPAGT